MRVWRDPYFIVEKQYGSSEKEDRWVARSQQSGTQRGGAQGSTDARAQQGRPENRPYRP
jgi:hypothetical protein